jgi:negative regulator of flagellin synthesis FlgM
MKIESNNIVPAVTTNTSPEKTGAAAGNSPEKARSGSSAAPTSSSSQGVPVTMSKQASNMAQLQQASVSDVNQQKVDSVRAAIQQGTFKVNAGAIADKMLATAQEMLQKKSN